VLQKVADRPNGELTCTLAYIQSKGYLEVTSKKQYNLSSSLYLCIRFSIPVIKCTNLLIMDILGIFKCIHVVSVHVDGV